MNTHLNAKIFFNHTIHLKVIGKQSVPLWKQPICCMLISISLALSLAELRVSDSRGHWKNKYFILEEGFERKHVGDQCI